MSNKTPHSPDSTQENLLSIGLKRRHQPIVHKAFLLCTILFFGLSPSFEASFAQSVTQSFEKARKLYEQGKLRSAFTGLRTILKKYPGHQPSILLSARILFRSNKISSAARYYKRVDPGMLNAEAAYEYGIVMFQTKQCEQAHKGFARVPGSSKLSSLAYFYRGVCYSRSQNYERANFYLSKAKRLPANLESARRQGLTQIRKQLKAERQGSFQSASNPYLIVPTPTPGPVYVEPPQQPLPPGSDQLPPPPQAEKKPEPPPPPPTGFNNAITPSFTYSEISRTGDLHGFGASESEEKKTELKLSFKSKYSASPRSFGGQPYFNLALDFNQVGKDVRGTEVEYIAFESDPTSIVENPKKNTSATSKALEINAVPEVGFPVTSSLEIVGNFTSKNSLADMKADKRTSETGPGGIINIDLDSVSGKLSGSQIEKVNAEGKATKSTTTFAGELTKEFETASLGVSGNQAEVTPGEAAPIVTGTALGENINKKVKLTEFLGVSQVFAGTLTKRFETISYTATVTQTSTVPIAGSYLLGPEEQLKLELSGRQTYDFGGTLTLTVAQIQFANYRDEVVHPTKTDESGKGIPTDLTATGTEQSVFFSFKLAPLSWLSATISYKYATLSYTVSDAELARPFQQKTADLKTEYSAVISLSKTY